jgi:hypothetical protein
MGSQDAEPLGDLEAIALPGLRGGPIDKGGWPQCLAKSDAAKKDLAISIWIPGALSNSALPHSLWLAGHLARDLGIAVAQ